MCLILTTNWDEITFGYIKPWLGADFKETHFFQRHPVYIDIFAPLLLETSVWNSMIPVSAITLSMSSWRWQLWSEIFMISVHVKSALSSSWPIHWLVKRDAWGKKHIIKTARYCLKCGSKPSANDNESLCARRHAGSADWNMWWKWNANFETAGRMIGVLFF